MASIAGLATALSVRCSLTGSLHLSRDARARRGPIRRGSRPRRRSSAGTPAASCRDRRTCARPRTAGRTPGGRRHTETLPGQRARRGTQMARDRRTSRRHPRRRRPANSPRC